MRKLLSAIMLFAAVVLSAGEKTSAHPAAGAPYAASAMFEALGIPKDQVREAWHTPELKLRAAQWHDTKLRFESGHIGIYEVWDRELAALRALMGQPEVAASPLMPELIRAYSKRLKQQLDMLKLEYESGFRGLETVRKKEFEIAEFRKRYGLPENEPNTELVELAEKHLVKVYGERVLKERPWRVADNGDTLTIMGKKLPPGCCGGVAEITIRKSDGKILKCIHYK